MKFVAIVIAFLGFVGLLLFSLLFFVMVAEVNSATDLLTQGANTLQAILAGQFLTISILVLGGGIALYLYAKRR